MFSQTYTETNRQRQTDRQTDRQTHLNASESSEFSSECDSERVATAADATEVLIEAFRQGAPETKRTPERVTTYTQTLHRVRQSV